MERENDFYDQNFDGDFLPGAGVGPDGALRDDAGADRTMRQGERNQERKGVRSVPPSGAGGGTGARPSQRQRRTTTSGSGAGPVGAARNAGAGAAGSSRQRTVGQTSSSRRSGASGGGVPSGQRPNRGAAGGRRGRSRRKNRKKTFILLLFAFLALAAVCLAGVYLLLGRDSGQVAGSGRNPMTGGIRSQEAAGGDNQTADGGGQTAAAGQETQQTSSGAVNLDVLASPYAILLDGESGEVLATKRGEEKIFPASMVKMMTVLTAIEHISDLDRQITMSYDYYDALYEQDASRAGFEPGEEAKPRELLYGALLPSGAECCMQLAIEAAGSESAFVDLMNENARSMGLVQTNFTNATGLHSTDQYSTPHEIATILREGLKNDTFYDVITTHRYSVPPTSIHPEGFTFWSTMFKNMVDEVVNGGLIMGGKTGFTSEAGHCLASFAEINGKRYILVTAGWAQNTDSETYHISDAFLAYNQIEGAL